MAGVEKKLFGRLSDGRQAELFTLKGNGEVTVSLCNYGAAIVSILCPDRAGNIANIVTGFDDVSGYEMQNASMGVICGRVAGRITGGRFTIDGKEYSLVCNNGENHLHGGINGFSRKLWDYNIPEGDIPAVEFKYLSSDGEEGYPGTLKTSVTYSLDGNRLIMDIKAVSDAATIVNMTNHAYFNLTGDMTKTAMGHLLQINADSFIEIDKNSSPTGNILPVLGTPFDFTSPHTMCERIDHNHEQLIFGAGYDHAFCLRSQGGPAALVYEPDTGRELKIDTNQSAVVLYTGNYLDGSIVGSGNVAYNKRSGFCMETQMHTDAINHPNFPSIILREGQTYHNKTVYTLSANS